jgi:hypothetical protein
MLNAANDVLVLPTQDTGSSEGDAAGDSATTDSESVSDIQLVRGGGEQRTLFKLTLQVRQGWAEQASNRWYGDAGVLLPASNLHLPCYGYDTCVLPCP